MTNLLTNCRQTGSVEDTSLLEEVH